MVEYSDSAETLVVGGGMAGLAAALAVRKNGATVTLVERSSEFGEVGAGLQMAPNATRVLRRWGLLAEVIEVGVRPEHLVFRDALTGEEIARQKLSGEFEQRYGAPYVVVHRSDLHKILLKACQDAGVRLLNDVSIERVETTEAGGRAYATNGDVYAAEVVLGADGLKSTLRSCVSADQPVPSGYVAYRGVVATDDLTAADLNDVVVYIGPNCHLVQYPLRKGELLNTVAVFKSASFGQGHEQFGGSDELEAAYKDCVPAVRNALRNLGMSMRWPMFDRDPIANWAHGRLLLIGDAAHPMLQYLAQGACQALEDAAVLEELSREAVVAGHGSDAKRWDAVIAAFNAARAPRTERVQRTARDWGEAWHISGMGRTLRNMLFKSRAASDFHYTDWLYGEVPIAGSEQTEKESVATRK